MIKELPFLLVCLCVVTLANSQSSKAVRASAHYFPFVGGVEGLVRDFCLPNEQPFWKNINDWIRVKSNIRSSLKNQQKVLIEDAVFGNDNLIFSPNPIVTNIYLNNQQGQGKQLMSSSLSFSENGTVQSVFGETEESRYDLSSFRHRFQQLCHHSSEKLQFSNFGERVEEDKSWNQLNSYIFTFIALFFFVLCSYGVFVKFLKEKEVLHNKLFKLQVEKQQIKLNLNSQLEAMKQKCSFYEVHWERLVDQVYDKKCYDHKVYEGRFINQQTYVYVIKKQGTDLATLERKLNKLLKCSHSRLSKLYFYTQTDQHLLVFTQKLSPLASQNLPQYLNINAPESAKRKAITEIIDTINYLEHKIELKWLPLHSIQLQYKIVKEQGEFQFKINAIPCLFRRMPDRCDDQQFDTASEEVPCFVRHNIAALFHLILMNGNSYNKSKQIQVTHRDALSQQYKQFLTFILYEARAVGHTHELLFKQVKDHPFLWDTKRKILFLSDFSNYIETHLDQQKADKLQDYANYYDVVEQNWSKPLHHLLAEQINNYRKYDFQSVRDLVRMIRNKINHFHEIPKQTKVHVGKTPERFMEYCLDKFPKLLYFAYNYTRKKKWRLHMK